MCGRLALSVYLPDLAARFMAQIHPGFAWLPRYNIPPKSDLPYPIVIAENNQRVIEPALWGLQPAFIADPGFRTKYSTFNAKAETLLTTRSFKPSVEKNQVCLIPLTGFYEWRRAGKKSQPFYFTSCDESVFSLAGLWARWQDRKTGEELLSFTLITTGSNSLMRPIHHRMPVVLSKEQETQWLDPDKSGDKKLALLQPSPPEILKTYPVCREFVNFGKDTPECIAPAP